MKQGTKLLISGLLAFLGGGVLLPFVLFGLMVAILCDRPDYTFVVPGQITVSCEKEGRYYLWYDYQTIFEGKTYSESSNLPGGMSIEFINVNTGEVVPLTSAAEMSETIGNTSRKTIGYFDIRECGEYTLEVSGGTRELVFSLGRSAVTMPRLLFLFFVGGPLSFLLGGAGVLLVVIGAIKLAKTEGNKPMAGRAPQQALTSA